MQKTNLKSEFLVDTNRQTTLLQQEILNSKDPIYLIKDPSGKGYKSAVFIDVANKKVIKRIDISINNPYTSLNYKKATEYNYQGNPVYIVDNKPLKIVMPKLDLKHYMDSIGEWKITSLSTFQNIISFNNYAIEIFEQRAFSDNYNVACMSTINIYDIVGSLIAHISDIETNVLDIEITENGKYLSLNYGIDNEDYGHILKTGVFVYNTTNNRIIFDDYNGAPGMLCKHNLVIIGKILNHSSVGQEIYQLIEVHDFEKNLTYSRGFTRSELEKIIDISNEGYILKNPDGTVTTLYFEKQFKVEKF